MVNLTFYGGVNEIGGNKILLEDKDAKIFLDFGMSFGQANKYFSEFLQPRKCGGLSDFFEFGLLPDIYGLYRSDFLKHMGRREEELGFDGVLLSHAHADHASYINHLREDLPIFCSPESYAILKALNDTGSSTFNDITDLTRCFETYINKNGDLSRKTTLTHEDLTVERAFQVFDFGKSFNIKHLEIEPFRVDHSLAGATGYIIHTSSGTIVYTGDFRFHGRRQKDTLIFMEKCKEAKPDVLVIEGTRIDDDSSKTEADVEDEICTYSADTKGLSVCNWSIRDTDRMLSFLNASKKMGKKLAISLKQAYLLEQLAYCKNSLVPVLDDDNIELYANRKSWGLIGDETCDQRILHQDYDKWERQYLERTICYKHIREKQDEYLMFCSNFDLKELIDIGPAKGSVYIKSACEPFDSEMRIDWKRVRNWLNHFGVKVNRTHVSGHASGSHLKEFIQQVNAKNIIPIHTENATTFKKWTENTILLTNISDSYTF